MKMENLVTINKGFIRFEYHESFADNDVIIIVPLATFSMKMEIVDEDEGRYNHYFYNDGEEYTVDGATWIEAEEKLMGN